MIRGLSEDKRLQSTGNIKALCEMFTDPNQATGYRRRLPRQTGWKASARNVFMPSEMEDRKHHSIVVSIH